MMKNNKLKIYADVFLVLKVHVKAFLWISLKAIFNQ